MHDADTITPSTAELQIRNHRKVIISLAAVLVAGLSVLHDATQTGNGLNSATWVIALGAVAQSALTYFPGNAVIKLVASGFLAILTGVMAAVTDGVTQMTMIQVLTQFLVWVAAGATENGARPQVVLAAQRNVPEAVQ